MAERADFVGAPGPPPDGIWSVAEVTVAAALVLDMVAYLRAKGVDAEAAADPEIGLHMGVAFNPGALDIVGYVMLSSRTADEALRRGARLMRLLNDGLDLHVERGRTTTTVRLVILPRAHELMRTETRHVVDTVIAGLVHQLRLLTHAPVVPAAVAFRYAKPGTGDAELTRLVGVKPRFGTEHDMVTLANADLDVPLRSANAALL